MDQTVCPCAGRGCLYILARIVSSFEKGGLYVKLSRKADEYTLTITLIPYSQWSNRGENEMRVWLNKK